MFATYTTMFNDRSSCFITNPSVLKVVLDSQHATLLIYICVVQYPGNQHRTWVYVFM